MRADGTYAYQLNNQLQAVQELESGKTLTETITIYVTDATGEVVPTPVTVTFNGTDDRSRALARCPGAYREGRR